MRHRPGPSVLLLVLLVAVFAGCAPEPEEVEEPEYDVLYFRSLLRGNNSAIQDTTETVIRTETEWEELKPKLRYFEEPREVDFSQAMLVVVAIPVDTGGYQLEVDTIEYGDDMVIVTYFVYEPGGDCLNVAVDVTPYQVVEVRRVDAPVTFRRIREYVFCNENL